MEQIILVIHVIAAIAVIGLVLIQQGKGSDVGASFGTGASQTFFGSQGSGSFLTRSTALLVTLFFITSLSLAFIASHRNKPKNIEELIKKVETQSQANEGAIPAVKREMTNDIPVIPSKSENKLKPENKLKTDKVEKTEKAESKSVTSKSTSSE